MHGLLPKNRKYVPVTSSGLFHFAMYLQIIAEQRADGLSYASVLLHLKISNATSFLCRADHPCLPSPFGKSAENFDVPLASDEGAQWDT